MIIKPTTGQFDIEPGAYGRMDLYCRVTLGTQVQSTKVAQNCGKNPIWRDNLEFKTSGEHNCTFEFFNKDHMGVSTYLGGDHVVLVECYKKNRMVKTLNVTFRGQQIAKVNVKFEWQANNPLPNEISKSFAEMRSLQTPVGEGPNLPESAVQWSFVNNAGGRGLGPGQSFQQGQNVGRSNYQVNPNAGQFSLPNSTNQILQNSANFGNPFQQQANTSYQNVNQSYILPPSFNNSYVNYNQGASYQLQQPQQPNYQTYQYQPQNQLAQRGQAMAYMNGGKIDPSNFKH